MPIMPSMKAILALFMSLIFFSGCKISYKKSNLAEASSVASTGVYLNTKVCLEGAYVSEAPLVMSTTLNSLDMIPTVTPYQSTAPWYHYSFNDLTLTPEILALGVFVDWVLVEVYQDVNGTMTYKDGQSALIHENGTLYDSSGFQGILFPSLTKGNYYINIIHRNHLSIGSNSYVYLSEAFDDATYNIDFTLIPPTTVYLTGSASTTKGAATQCLMVGDLDGNLLVDAADEAEI